MVILMLNSSVLVKRDGPRATIPMNGKHEPNVSLYIMDEG